MPACMVAGTPLREQLARALAANERLQAENERLWVTVAELSDQVVALRAELARDSSNSS